MKLLTIRVHEDITSHEWVQARSKQHGIRRYAGQTISREEWSGKYQRWVIKTRVLDKLRDWYKEHVIDPATGAILHEHVEPLSAHQGHGAAKKRLTDHEEQP